MKVSDFMITDVITVKKETTVRELLDVLITNKIGGVPVVDDDGHLLGMISDGDILRYINPRESTVYDFFYTVYLYEAESTNDAIDQSLDQPVSELMTRKRLVHHHPGDPFKDVLRSLSKHRFKKIPVIDDNEKVVGVISRGDVLRYIVEQVIKNQ